MHGIKGEASALGFEAIEMRTHQFEETLVQLRDKSGWSSEEFLSLPIVLNGLFDQIHQIETIVIGLENYSTSEHQHETLTSDSIRTNLNTLVVQLAKNQHKEIILEANLKVLNQYNDYISNEL